MQGRSFAYAMVRMSEEGTCEPSVLLDSLMLNKIRFLAYDSVNENPDITIEDHFIAVLEDASPMSLMELIERQDYRQLVVDTRDIPQFSDVKDACRTVEIMAASEQHDVTFPELGMYLDPTGSRSAAASQKYGENHFKLAQQLGLVSISSDGHKFANILGRGFTRVKPQTLKDELIGKLSLRIPFIQYVLLKAQDNTDVRVIDELCARLAKSTALRRRSNIETLSKYIFNLKDPELSKMLSRVDWESLR